MGAFGSPVFGSTSPGNSGSGNATVPNGTSPSDPQEFVDAAVAVAGDLGVWFGANSAPRHLNNEGITRMVFTPSTLSNRITLDDNTIVSAIFPNLVTIPSSVNTVLSINSSPSLETLSMPLLETCGAPIRFRGTTGLTSVAFPSLVEISVNGIFDFLNSGLETISLPSGVIISGTLDLTGTQVSVLGFGGDWLGFEGKLYCGGTQLATLPFENLVTLQGEMYFDSCLLITNPNFAALESITGILSLAGCANATGFGMPSLQVCSGQLLVNGFTSADPLTSLADLASVNFSGGSLTASGIGLGSHGLGSIVNLDFNLDLNTNSLVDAEMDDLEEISDGYSLRLDSNLIEEPSFPALVALDGVLNLEQNNMLVFSAPALVSIGSNGRLLLDNNAHTQLNLFALETCNGVIYAGSCDINLPSLTTVGTGAEIASTGAGVTAIDLSSLTYINGHLNLSGSSGGLEVPVLTGIGPDGTLNLESTTGDVGMDFGSLEAVDGTLSFNESVGIGSVAFTSLAAISGTVSFLRSSVADVGFPSLTSISGLLNLSECGSLASISFGSLTSISGELRIQASNLDQSNMDGLISYLYSVLSAGGHAGLIDFSGYINGDPQSAPAWSDLVSVITVIV
jgi:hypothetical protein